MIKRKSKRKTVVSLGSKDYINEFNREFSDMIHHNELMEFLNLSSSWNQNIKLNSFSESFWKKIAQVLLKYFP